MAVAGIAGAVVVFVTGLSSIDDAVADLQRIPVPGERTVTFSRGAQAVYFESSNGQNVNVPPLKIRMVAVDGGRVVPLRDYSGSTQYSIDGHDGQSIAGFDSPAEGRYRVTVSARDEALPSHPVVAMGAGVGHHIVWTVVGGLGLLFVGLLACGGWIALTAVRRRRRR